LRVEVHADHFPQTENSPEEHDGTWLINVGRNSLGVFFQPHAGRCVKAGGGNPRGRGDWVTKPWKGDVGSPRPPRRPRQTHVAPNGAFAIRTLESVGLHPRL
jgi:hypothetical protein